MVGSVQVKLLFIAVALISSSALSAKAPKNPFIDYAGFETLTGSVGQQRAQRLISFAQFKAKAAAGNAIILDARSKDAFAAGHIDGAINLPFTDFTADSLAAALGKPGRPILIYCNNNFSNNQFPVRLKATPLALNIQTFINLVGYGYDNVWELNEVLDFNDARVGWKARAS
jgi:phage shock protein E